MEKYITEHEINELLNNVKHLINTAIIPRTLNKTKRCSEKTQFNQREGNRDYKRSREKLS